MLGARMTVIMRRLLWEELLLHSYDDGCYCTRDEGYCQKYHVESHWCYENGEKKRTKQAEEKSPTRQRKLLGYWLRLLLLLWKKNHHCCSFQLLGDRCHCSGLEEMSPAGHWLSSNFPLNGVVCCLCVENGCRVFCRVAKLLKLLIRQEISALLNFAWSHLTAVTTLCNRVQRGQSRAVHLWDKNHKQKTKAPNRFDQSE